MMRSIVCFSVAVSLAGCGSNAGGQSGTIPSQARSIIRIDATTGPKITKVTRIVAKRKVQTFEIDGKNFGTQYPYDGDSNYMWLYDLTGDWRAGCGPPNPCTTTLNVTSWTDNQIVVSGFTGNGQTPNRGDRMLVLVWDAYTGHGPVTRAVTVAR